MNDDAELLRRYVQDHAEAAFSELVRRHIGLVYGCALRRVGRDPQHAEDVTQKVFCDLARKAPSLAKRPALSGWLYVSTQLAAAEVVRKERRRKAREAQAITMENILDAPAAGPEPDWDRLRPLLDHLILGLKRIDRDAVVLRFFEKRSFAEIAATLRLTEEAARKQVDRAVEKLRGQLADRGVTSGSAALTLALTEQATVAVVPAALVAHVTGCALAELATAAAGTSLVASFTATLTSGIAALVATLLAGGALVAWQHRTNQSLEAELARLSHQRQEVAGLERENHSLVRRIAEAEDLRRAQAEMPVSRETPPAASPSIQSVNLAITNKGTLRWNGEPVALNTFIQRLLVLQTQHPDQAGVVIHGEPGAAFGPMDYVVEQASKTGVKNITVDSPAAPAPAGSWITGAFMPPSSREVNPPTVPEPTVSP
jgi:RNA polymerase sigma factor (sigma-70 family)